MSQLRLLPAALLSWTAALGLLLSGSGWWILIVVLVAVVVALVLRSPGQAVVCAAAATATGATGWARLNAVGAHWLQAGYRGPFEATLTQTPRLVSNGMSFASATVAGYPVPVPVLWREDIQPTPAAGSTLVCEAAASSSDRVGVGGVLVHCANPTVTAPPSGLAGIAAAVKEGFAHACARAMGQERAGLVRGMVLGDVGGQDTATRQLYQDTGLSHLSAVSGANVALVVGAVVLVARLLGAGPKTQVAAGLISLAGFCTLVGLEPSVLRAAVSGILALIAVGWAKTTDALHAVSVAVVVLIIIDTDLAASYGFALSIAATCGIVVLTPLLLRPLASTGMPKLLAQAITVAVAADAATMPVVALMVGKVSLVGVLANIVVAAAVAPITIGGVVAVCVGMIPLVGDVIAHGILWCLNAPAWWIVSTAHVAGSRPHPTVPLPGGTAGILAACLIAAWVVALISVRGWKRLLGVILTSVGIVVGLPDAVGRWWVGAPLLPPGPWENAPVIVVDTFEEAANYPLNHDDNTTAQPPAAIVVRHPPQQPSDRPWQRVDGVPIVVEGFELLRDGSQRARTHRQ